jgi:hypothetical protein
MSASFLGIALSAASRSMKGTPEARFQSNLTPSGPADPEDPTTRIAAPVKAATVGTLGEGIIILTSLSGILRFPYTFEK